jgi:hypothetical protein
VPRKSIKDFRGFAIPPEQSSGKQKAFANLRYGYSNAFCFEVLNPDLKIKNIAKNATKSLKMVK